MAGLMALVTHGNHDIYLTNTYYTHGCSAIYEEDICKLCNKYNNEKFYYFHSTNYCSRFLLTTYSFLFNNVYKIKYKNFITCEKCIYDLTKKEVEKYVIPDMANIIFEYY